MSNLKNSWDFLVVSLAKSTVGIIWSLFRDIWFLLQLIGLDMKIRIGIMVSVITTAIIVQLTHCWTFWFYKPENILIGCQYILPLGNNHTWAIAIHVTLNKKKITVKKENWISNYFNYYWPSCLSSGRPVHASAFLLSCTSSQSTLMGRLR